MTTEWLSYKDLRAAGIVSNWQTLRTWQRTQAFPAGRLFGPNTRRWSRAEIEEWLASRPAAGAAKQRDHADT
jgi:hypothetical protein